VTERTREQGRGVGGKSRRTTAWLAWLMWALSMLPIALSVPLYLSIPAARTSGITDVPDTVAGVLFTAVVLSFCTVGALIATRRPQNTVGWIMLVAGFALAANVLASGYVDFSAAQPEGRLPGTQWVAWFAQWIWVPGIAPALTFLLLLFPDGRLPSRRWRFVGWLAVAAMVTLGLGMAFTPGPLADYPRGRAGVLAGASTLVRGTETVLGSPVRGACGDFVDHPKDRT
jgi:two-component system, NarL family, sensor kinase